MLQEQNTHKILKNLSTVKGRKMKAIKGGSLNYVILALILIFTLSACGGGGGGGGGVEPENSFTIQANSAPSNAGTITGTGEYDPGSTVTLIATPNAGYIFAEWLENDTPISDQITLEVEASDDKNFTARFTERTVEELKISPENSKAPLYTNIEFQVQAIYNDGSSEVVSQSAIWESADTSIAAFDSQLPNILTSKAEGTVTVTVTIGGTTAATTATISSPDLLSLALSKNESTLALGETESILATGNYRGDVTRDITNTVSWTSQNEGIATVGDQEADAGTISSVSVGTTKIIASLNGISAEATVVVDSAALTLLTISNNSTSIFEGSVSQFLATANYTDGSSKAVTEQVTWSSSDLSVASVSATGLVSALSTGSVAISAQLGELSANTTLDVVISPNNPAALTLQAIPNVILDNGSDTSNIIATVLPIDEENGVITDGTMVTFTQNNDNLVLGTLEGGTVSGQVVREAVGTSAGQYDVIAEVSGTVAIDQTTVQVVSSFHSVISVNGSFSTGAGGGASVGSSTEVWAGSEFNATVINTSNRSFNLQSAILLNGTSLVGISTDPAILGGGTLEAGESVGITFTLSQDIQSNGLSIVFDLLDTPTGTTFAVTWESPF